MDLQRLLEEIAEQSAPLAAMGKVADYIPGLACVDRTRFGMAVATVEGEVLGTGDWRTPFSIQSISKVFTLVLALARDGEKLWSRVGREPSGDPFNSLVQLEHEHGIPRNPFINAGALVVTDRLLTLEGDSFGALRSFLRVESRRPDLDTDLSMALSEAEHGHRNAALAHFMASFGNLENPVDRVLDHYFRQCAISMSCEDLVRAGLFLATHGVRADGARMLTRSETKRINAVMLTCGTYDSAGDFAFRVGLPGKSGVGGGILAIIPGRCSLCVWSPALEPSGNSLAGVDALDRFTTRTGWSVF